jgi:alpha-beta hydrolase superfamily lysophospholipase
MDRSATVYASRVTSATAPSTTATATTRDGTTLLTRHWTADGDPWATALIVHGLSEHSGRYERVGGWLSSAGIDVRAYDQRGWGGSGGPRGDVVRWDDLLDDLAERVAAAHALAGGRPLVLYGHSMGGLVVTGYALSDRPLPDLLVLSAPGIDSTHPRWVRLLSSVGGAVVPTMRPPIGSHDGSRLSRDPAVGAAFAVDPLAVHAPTARFGARAFTAQKRARAAIDRLAASGEPFPVRTLVIHGTGDRIIPCECTERFERFPNVTRRTYPDLRHELHNEPEGKAIVGDVIAWLRAPSGR